MHAHRHRASLRRTSFRLGPWVAWAPAWLSALGAAACADNDPAPPATVVPGGNGVTGAGASGGAAASGGAPVSAPIVGPGPWVGGSSAGGSSAGAPPSGGAGQGAGGSSPNLSLCGNGRLDGVEECDDGNAAPGDGCSGQCFGERDYLCEQPGLPCVSTVECGNGQLEGAEQCDDGNDALGDGCSECSIDTGFGCNSNGCFPLGETAECGDGVKSASEACDDGNLDANDGCGIDCEPEEGFSCLVPGQPCTRDSFCGDGRVDPGNPVAAESCDDGNTRSGDGCSFQCGTESNFVCPSPGEACVSTIVCGDGVVVRGAEACDDGNDVDGDGCASNCLRVEAGFTCPQTELGEEVQGGPCTAAVQETCGDAQLAATEACDDGNDVAGDGCSSSCLVESGYNCPTVGALCQLVAFCGDGRVQQSSGEACDDGNGLLGDGCSACRLDANTVCTGQPSQCTSTVSCGDGVVAGAETCDPAPGLARTGCTVCQVDAGFSCAAGGLCRALCGDGLVAGFEQCDDGNLAGGDGCSSSCRLEPGFDCDNRLDPDAQTCVATVCGDGVVEGTEPCDDGNLLPYDGCNACVVEPQCGFDNSIYTCGAECGDGLRFPGEACDDGNQLDGDGCSSTCSVETGFDCTDLGAALGSTLELPIVLRDFLDSHAQFEIQPDGSGLMQGMVLPQLDTDGQPAVNPAFSVNGRLWTLDAPSQTLGGSGSTDAEDTPAASFAAAAALFKEWYRDVPGVNQTFVETLLLEQQPDGSFQFAASGANQFFPLDAFTTNSTIRRGHNFHFTSEARQWFVFDPNLATNPVLTFSGDDDVWVFVNGQLTVDLGGIHGEIEGSVELNVAESGANSVVLVDGVAAQTIDVPLNTSDVNEIAVFQAERHVTESNYTLTLRGFEAPLSSCQSTCGDGVQASNEACDDGAGNQPLGSYEACDVNCELGPRCGDGQTQSAQGEACDDGLNIAVYGAGCGPGCRLPPRCGDGSLDSGQGEACDDGQDNAPQGTYGACDANCQLGPRCGDGVAQPGAGEQCDDGAQNGSAGSACLADCRLRCGNGQVEQGEQCDDGDSNAAPGTLGYGQCLASVQVDGAIQACVLGPRCGDGLQQTTQGEECDDGLNNGQYGTCNGDCTLAPSCGDGQVQAEFGEACDDGSANTNDYGEGNCRTDCQPGPYCGDSAVQRAFGEVCDDGVNDGTRGSCTPNCGAYVPLPSCGDGKVVGGEDCDLGAENGAPGAPCDSRCQWACGNGVVDAAEQCDNGTANNNGGYGTCQPDCTFAAYCGDGIVQSQFEQCDLGASNLPGDGAYGPGLCTTTCSQVPFCGDGRVDRIPGVALEECDGSVGCGSACRRIR